MYKKTVEDLARASADHCHNNTFRRFLSLRHLPIYYGSYSDFHTNANICRTWAVVRSLPGNNCICGECMKCPKCGDFWSSTQTPNAIHSNVGNYEFWPDVYIANELHKPWYELKRPTHYASPVPSDFIPGLYTELMTEEEALHSFHELLETYPNTKPWIPLSTLHIALYLKWDRMARKLAECIERRMDFFTPSGPYVHLSESWTRDQIVQFQFNKNMEAREGMHNYPIYIYANDIAYLSRTFTNPCTFMISCIDSAPERRMERLEFYGSIWSVSSAYWANLEKESLFNESIRRIFCIVMHINGATQMSVSRHWPNIMKRPFESVISHTSRTRCQLCNDSTLQQPGEPVTTYQNVLSYAYRLRQRRFWGVLVCAVRLIVKARAVHFVPGIGSAYKAAAAEFMNLLKKTA
jgi:hypothetical protein